MEFNGRFVGGLRIDIESRKVEFTIQSDTDISKDWDNLRKHDPVTVSIKPFRRKRSLDANAYYWQLLTKLAEAVGVSKPAAHNMMLRRYGQLEEYGGRLVYVVVPDTPEGAEKALEAETYHIKPTSEVKIGNDGTMFRTYKMLRGSSTYDTREMSVLINGMVDECRIQGIETMTPVQIDEMMKLYDAKWKERHEKNT